MKTLIFGAGPLGSLYASLLFKESYFFNFRMDKISTGSF